MTAYTQSGFPVIADYGDSQLISSPVVPGTGGVKVLGGLRAGDPAVVLLYVLSRWHVEVEPLVQDLGVWGYDKRDIRGGDGWSNHAGGVAVDADASIHPQGAQTMSPAQVAGVRKIIADVNGMAGATVLDWGGEWSGSTRDEMHVQLHGNVSTLALATAAQKIQAAPEPPAPTPPAPAPAPTPPLPEDAVTPQDIKDIARATAEVILNSRVRVEISPGKSKDVKIADAIAGSASKVSRILAVIVDGDK